MKWRKLRRGSEKEELIREAVSRQESGVTCAGEQLEPYSVGLRDEHS